MADIYSYPTENQTTSINGIAEYVSQVTSGLFFPLVLLAMFIITFVSTMHFGPGRAFVFASFFCSLIAIFLVVGGLLNSTYMYLLFVSLGIGLMLKRLGKSSSQAQI